MTKRKIPFNPSRFSDMLQESVYPTGPKGEKLKREREDLVVWLRKKTNSQACLELADELENCRRRHRCKSAACPECAAGGQKLVADAAGHLLKTQARGAKVVFVTIIPIDGVIKPGKLSRAGVERAVRRWKERLGKAKVGWFVGAVDWSLNEDKRGRRRWSVHMHGVTVTNNPGKLTRRLQKHFPRTKVIRRPVMVVEWDNDEKALRYILKPSFRRRIANHGQRYDKKNGDLPFMP
jgi:hypothetical protein